MKRIRWIAGVLFSMVLLCSLFLTAKADDGETAGSTGGTGSAGGGYTYTVRFYAGKQGTIQGGEVVAFTGLNYGDRVNFYQGDVSLNDNSKYYIKGIRESGKDNSTAQYTSFTVTGDQDYVVAYGLLNDAVSYTVHYVEASSGKALAESETYYGNVGDKPVIAYRYIDGYQPQAYNLTKTLSANAAENVFTFKYTYIGSSSGSGTHTHTTTETESESQTDGGTRTIQGATQVIPGGTQVIPGQGTQVVEGGNEAGGGNGAGAGADAADQETAPSQPQELIDIDDEEVPLAIGADDSTPKNIIGDAIMLFRRSLVARIIGMTALLVIAAMFLWFMLVRKRKKDEE